MYDNVSNVQTDILVNQTLDKKQIKITNHTLIKHDSKYS